MNPFVMSLFSGAVMLSFVIALATYTNTDLDITLYILSFVGVFVGSFFVTIIDDDLKLDKQIKKSLDKRNNKNFTKENTQ